jgi:hypothetical protein
MACFLTDCEGYKVDTCDFSDDEEVSLGAISSATRFSIQTNEVKHPVRRLLRYAVC